MNKRKRLISLFITLCMVFTMSVPSVVWADTKSDDIVILYTNDVHTYIDGEVSYDVLAGLKKELETRYNHVLLVDAGDHAQGTAYGSMDKGKTIIDLMNATGYDLATLGNHEFDYGMDGRINITDNWADFDYISCNFYEVEGDVIGDTVLDATKTYEGLGNWDVKFVGITTPESFTKSTPAYFQDGNGNYIYGIAGGEDGEELYNAVQNAISTTDDNDIVIALGHLGDDPSSMPWTSEEVIANVTGLDAFIDGHSHNTVEGKVIKDEANNDVLLTQTGEYFKNIGIMVIDAETGKITTQLLGAADAAALYASDASVKAIKDAWIEDIEEQLGVVIGKAEVVFDNYDAENNRLVRKQGTNTGAFAADALYYLFDNMDMDIDVAIMNGGGVRNKAITGDISYKTCKEIHTFGNVACLQTITGQQLLDALEWGAKDYPNENGGFLHVSGLTYDIDITVDSTVQKDDKGVWTGAPTGEYRVKNVEILNNETGEYEPIDLTAKYNLAGYNYTLRDLGDGFAMFDGAVNVLDYVMEDYLVLANYVKSFPDGVITAENSPYGAVTDESRINITCGDHVFDMDGVCTVCGDDAGLTDAQKVAWAAHLDLIDALAGDDIEALDNALDANIDANEDLEYEDIVLLDSLDNNYWGALFNASIISDVNYYAESYLEDKNALTAYDLVSYFEFEEVSSIKEDITRFVPDIDDILAEAEEDFPSDSVIAVSDTYWYVEMVLMFGIVDEDTYAAAEEFAEAEDVLNALTDEELEDLAALIGAEDGEAAKEQVAKYGLYLNTILEVEEVYQAYLADPTADTAKAFIEKYDAIYSNGENEELQELVKYFYMDIEDVYAEAKTLVPEEDSKDEGDKPQDKPQSGDTDKEEQKAPVTGDTNALILWMAVALVAGMAGTIVARREE